MKKKKKKQIYFPKEVQEKIVEYINETDSNKKNKIYETYISYAFNKLVENTINNHRFPYIKECYDDIHHEVVYHLLTNMKKYDANKGKAFSYFCAIAKNYLIAWNDWEYKERKNQGEIDFLDSERDINTEISQEIRQKDAVIISDLLAEYFDNNIQVIFKKKRDIAILEAIVILLKRREYIHIFNKKAIYEQIRNITDVKTHYVTKIINKIKPIYKNLIKEYYRTGTIITKKKNRFV